MALIRLQNICWGFGGAPLMENLSLQIEKGERVSIIGRNGVGKSSLLKILKGDIQPDGGEIQRMPGIKITYLSQEVPLDLDASLFEVAAGGAGELGAALAAYRSLGNVPDARLTPVERNRRDALQQLLENADGWALLRQVDQVLSLTRLNPEDRFAGLSAGMKRRALFARALVPDPDLLLLDEPTNHLDIDAIIWMEGLIQKYVKTLLFVTHDRAFLQRIAGRIVELDRGRLISYNCDYGTYLERRQADLEAEARQNDLFDKKLSGEEAWIRQGIKARRTRNEGRVRALKEMRDAYKARRKKIGNAQLRIQEAERTGRLVIEADALNFKHGNVPIVKDFSFLLMRGDKVGIMGPNGSGKTTLLKLLLKAIEPDSGSVRHGTNLQIAYFDQLRAQLVEQKTVQENIGEGNDFIVFNNQKRHVISYLQDFLFSPERCRTPVYVLSGGEKNRLMLAKLFIKPANLLVLDEPTNDLDIETLELLEELLFDFQGTLLMVSHDRQFLNNVVTGTIAIEGPGQITSYPGGYDDWLDQRPKPETEAPKAVERAEVKSKPKGTKKRKLGFREAKELAELPQKIENLEGMQKELYAQMAAPDFYKQEKSAIASAKKRLDEIAAEIETAYRQWEMLEEINNG